MVVVPGDVMAVAIQAAEVAVTVEFPMVPLMTVVVLVNSLAATWDRVYIVISLSTVSSCGMVFTKYRTWDPDIACILGDVLRGNQGLW